MIDLVMDNQELPSKTLLLLLRESAMTNSNDQYKVTAKACADQLDSAIKLFTAMPTYANLIAVNSMWALGHRILNDLQPELDGGGGGSAGVDKWDSLHAVPRAA